METVDRRHSKGITSTETMKAAGLRGGRGGGDERKERPKIKTAKANRKI